MLSQILVYDQIVQGHTQHTLPVIYSFIGEIRNLGWPDAWARKVLKSIPDRFQSPFVRAVRYYARVLRLGVHEHMHAIAVSALTCPEAPSCDPILCAMGGNPDSQGGK
eukprot:7489510-Pyramimonas_sp.AAC.1